MSFFKNLFNVPLEEKTRQRMLKGESPPWRIISFERIITPQGYPLSPNRFVTPQELLQYIIYLRSIGSFISTSELHRKIIFNEEIPPFTFCLCFIGGYKEHSLKLGEVLAQDNIPATFYPPLDLIYNGDKCMWGDTIVNLCLFALSKQKSFFKEGHFDFILTPSSVGDDEIQNGFNLINTLLISPKDVFDRAMDIVKELIRENNVDDLIKDDQHLSWAEVLKLQEMGFEIGMIEPNLYPTASYSNEDLDNIVSRAGALAQAGQINLNGSFMFHLNKLQKHQIGTLANHNLKTIIGLSNIIKNFTRKKNQVIIYESLGASLNPSPDTFRQYICGNNGGIA